MPEAVAQLETPNAEANTAKRDAAQKAQIGGLLKTLGVLESGKSPTQTVTEASAEIEAKATAKPRAPDGKFAGKQEGAQGTQEPAGSTTAEKAPEIDKPAYEAARATLRRDQVPQAILDGMKPAELMAWADKVGARHKQNDEHARLMGELKKQVETKAKEPESAVTKQSGPAEQPVDWKARVQPFAEKLSLVDPDEVEALASFAKTVYEAAESAADKRAEARFDGLKRSYERVQGSVANMELRDARAELKSRYSKLADDKEFDDRVADMTAKLADLKQKGVDPGAVYSGMGDLLNEVCAVHYVSELQAEAAGAKHQKTQRDRDTGRPDRQTQTTQKAALSREDRQRATIGDYLRENGIV